MLHNMLIFYREFKKRLSNGIFKRTGTPYPALSIIHPKHQKAPEMLCRAFTRLEVCLDASRIHGSRFPPTDTSHGKQESRADLLVPPDWLTCGNQTPRV